MRVAFLGKGGSGKTSLTAGYIRWARTQDYPVLALDVDVNVHLCEALGIPEFQGRFLGESFDAVAEFLEPAREDYARLGLATIPCFGSVPPSANSHFIRLNANDPFLSSFGTSTHGVVVLAVGPHKESDFGSSCYHYKLNGVELVYHRLLDTQRDRVVTDSAAGTDSLGTSLYMCHDMQVFVVEPTMQSVAVYRDYATRAEPLGVKLHVVGNKLRSAADEKFLRTYISDEHWIAGLPVSQALRNFERGVEGSAEDFSIQFQEVWNEIDQRLVSVQRDWNVYFARLRALYEAECLRWWNPYYKTDLRDVEWTSVATVEERLKESH